MAGLMETPPPAPLWELLLEDGPLLAVNKSAGLLTQGVPHKLPALEWLVKDYLREKYQKPGNVYLGVPHRLDRPVSGIVVLAKNSKAAARLAEQFRERQVRKFYYGVTEVVPDRPADNFRDWLLKDAEAAHVQVVVPQTPGAKLAELRYRTLQVVDGRALVEVELITGRMHQIRVQFASRGWPIVGDVQYGAREPFPGVSEYDAQASMIALHAGQLHLSHPVRYDRLHLQAPLPAAWALLGFDLEIVLPRQLSPGMEPPTS
ncbi:RluA family pseudouridine synthase [Planctellipticum variicoloris]|uniref:RluA family pseudouridine synthase n=1 Tax=Planctellipticum variicoloris TaxID=3064265 RepID=UPI003013A7DA|nr:RNA pseudouridine synthase [Planctomycetaceae bacterium SH412]